MLLGLFFVTTGASMDVSLLLHEWNIVLSLLVGLIAVKIGIIGSLAPLFGLNRCADMHSPPVLWCAGCLVTLNGHFVWSGQLPLKHMSAQSTALLCSIQRHARLLWVLPRMLVTCRVRRKVQSWSNFCAGKQASAAFQLS